MRERLFLMGQTVPKPKRVVSHAFYQAVMALEEAEVMLIRTYPASFQCPVNHQERREQGMKECSHCQAELSPQATRRGEEA